MAKFSESRVWDSSRGIPLFFEVPESPLTQYRTGEGSLHIKMQEPLIRSAVSIELRLVTDTDRHTTIASTVLA